MKVFIARDPQAISFIQKRLLGDSDIGKEEFSTLLKDMLTYHKDEIFIPIVVEARKKEDIFEPEVVGFVIAFAPGNQSYVWIAQAWFDEGLEDEKTKDLLFIKLILWTLQQGRRELRGETRRETEKYLDLWGFQAFSKTKSYKIDENFEERILEQRENLNINSTPLKKSDPPKRKTADEIRAETKAMLDDKKG